MGYCYDENNHLLCDACGNGPARRYKCPFGYCPATALCAKCKADHPEYMTKATHRAQGCKSGMVRFAAEEASKAAALASGQWVLSSAVMTDDDRDICEVCFRNNDGANLMQYMLTKHYDGTRRNDGIDTLTKFKHAGAVADSPAALLAMLCQHNNDGATCPDCKGLAENSATQQYPVPLSAFVQYAML